MNWSFPGLLIMKYMLLFLSNASSTYLHLASFLAGWVYELTVFLEWADDDDDDNNIDNNKKDTNDHKDWHIENHWYSSNDHNKDKPNKKTKDVQKDNCKDSHKS